MPLLLSAWLNAWLQQSAPDTFTMTRSAGASWQIAKTTTTMKSPVLEDATFTATSKISRGLCV